MSEKTEELKATHTRATQASTTRVMEFPRVHEPLYPDSMTTKLFKTSLLDPETRSQQETSTGEKQPPIDMAAAAGLMQANSYHETCIHTKVSSIVGLGFHNKYHRDLLQWKQNPTRELPTGDPEEDSEASKKLDELCEGSSQTLLTDMCEDFINTGNGAFEVIRENGDPDSKIIALWQLPSRYLTVKVEKGGFIERHWIYRGDGIERHFARFGDKANFLKRMRKARQSIDKDKVSEVIHFRRPTSLSRYYGLPDWLSAVPAIELCQMIHQQQFDFFKNRGVPEFMLFLLGAQLDPDVWKQIEDAIRANIGSGNSHKSIGLNISNENIKVQLEKLAVEGKTDNSFQELNNVLSMEIVSSHRTPPLLAGLHIPAKIGANNELANALLGFQVLYVDQIQELFTSTLAATLGPELSLEKKDFRFRKVTDKYDMDKLDTMGRMKDEMGSPEGKSRDLSAGVKKELKEITSPQDVGELLARLYKLVRAVA